VPQTDYFPISDYGFLSDCRSAAISAKNGSIDWLCWPRFDSPSVFGKLLDSEKGGNFQVTPTKEYSVKRQYLPDTNVLQTTFTTASGVLRLTDWLHKGSRQALCRLIMGIEGQVDIKIVCDPRPNYGSEKVTWHHRLGYLVADVEDNLRLILDGVSDPVQELTIQEGEVLELTLGLNKPGPSDILSSLRRTVNFWEHWSESLVLPNYQQDIVKRSALVLKGLQYEPSGSIVAAATTSLPEEIGGERNYDYRFSWIRDASLTLHALIDVGKDDEAQSWFDWLKSVMLHTGSADLQIMYGINGETEMPEQTLDHLAGYNNSQPVRIGNAAAKQKQLDVYGSLMNTIWMHQRSTDRPLSRHSWLLVKALADRTCREWREPDEGIWEVRGGSHHFVYSKVMCWVALDRAIKLADEDHRLRVQAPLDTWRKERDAIRQDVLEYGYDEGLGTFTQTYGNPGLGAECLQLAEMGFISATDPRYISTVRAIQKDLTRNGLVDRYNHSLTHDGFTGSEGTFTICSLWLVLSLAQIGATEEAEELFEKVLACANDLGLLSEELSPEGEQLGNFPQAFSHIAIIACAFALDTLQHN
jgi:GH15 family glucan-1,4-alpha-glucosidase